MYGNYCSDNTKHVDSRQRKDLGKCCCCELEPERNEILLLLFLSLRTSAINFE